MALAGWIALAVAGISLAGFAIFEISKSQSHPKSAHGVENKRQPAQQNKESSSRADESDHQSSNYRAAEEKYGEGNLGNFLKFVARYDKAIVAISTVSIALFTIILAIATGFLWRATRDLVRGAEQTAEKQLRAYVFATTASICNFGTSQPMRVEVAVKNTGQTPAYKIKGWFRIRGDFNASASVEVATYVLGPGGEMFYRPVATRPLAPGEYSAALDGVAPIYVHGEIHYVDAFGVDHFTKVRLMYKGRGHVPPSADGALTLSFDNEGNAAN